MLNHISVMGRLVRDPELRPQNQAAPGNYVAAGTPAGGSCDADALESGGDLPF